MDLKGKISSCKKRSDKNPKIKEQLKFEKRVMDLAKIVVDL